MGGLSCPHYLAVAVECDINLLLFNIDEDGSEPAKGQSVSRIVTWNNRELFPRQFRY